MSATERTGWRDQQLSVRHRRWGFNAPAVDLDFLLVEYSMGEPVAVVEYKNHKAILPNFEHPTYRALRRLCDREPAIPFIVARYWPGSWAFRVTAVNDTAAAVFGDEADLSEHDYVTTLHGLRHLAVQESVARHLKHQLPPRQGALTLVATS